MQGIKMNRTRGQASLIAGLKLLPWALLSVTASVAMAQDEDAEAIEEITVTGTQIKGARISDALAVSVVSAEEIEILGVESGDELLAAIPEMGQNFFSEMDTAGGINSARGDVGAINMRNLGTGNTLVLLNGRRLVNMATYQTEEVGGSCRGRGFPRGFTVSFYAHDCDIVCLRLFPAEQGRGGQQQSTLYAANYAGALHRARLLSAHRQLADRVFPADPWLPGDRQAV